VCATPALRKMCLQGCILSIRRIHKANAQALSDCHTNDTELMMDEMRPSSLSALLPQGALSISSATRHRCTTKLVFLCCRFRAKFGETLQHKKTDLLRNNSGASSDARSHVHAATLLRYRHPWTPSRTHVCVSLHDNVIEFSLLRCASLGSSVCLLMCRT
jgi:hypothetical protein